MVWPTSQINSTNMDQGSDSPANARADLYALIQAVNQMIAESPVLQSGSVKFAGTAGGTVNALTAALNPVPSQLVDGMQIILRASGSNTAAATLNLNSLGARQITQRGGAALQPGAIAGTGHMLILVYHAGPTPRWELANPRELTNTGVSPGTYTAANITLDAAGRVTSASQGNTGFSAAVAFITPGVFTWVVPAGITKVHVKAWGGGGGGGYGGRYSGGGGGYAEGFYAVSPGQQIAVTVGAGGAGGINNNSAGGAGSASGFGPYLWAAGGSAGGGSPSAGGNAGGGHINLIGEIGTQYKGGNAKFGGSGGVSGSRLTNVNEAGDPATFGHAGEFPGGAGGAAGYDRDNSNFIEWKTGGNGAGGCVLIEY